MTKVELVRELTSIHNDIDAADPDELRKAQEQAWRIIPDVITALEAPHSMTEAMVAHWSKVCDQCDDGIVTLPVADLRSLLQAAHPIDHPMLTADEEDELVERINANPNLRAGR